MTQKNDVTDHTLEVDRDQDNKSTRRDVCGWTVCTSPGVLCPFRKTVKNKTNMCGRKQLER